ncbi:short chain dehydrogenase [Paracidovorax cattleyae]|uniref:Short chain dehydrogenase n=1 Tax=Paracidovorax cattleyae TaxID=80868 RepID=A0A1H0UYW6_9BURK|nr:short chain dehydrogenase [Paracidovorax cattleyae]
MQFHGRTIVITGVSSGIGSDTAKLLRGQGARVIGIDRNDPALTRSTPCPRKPAISTSRRR